MANIFWPNFGHFLSNRAEIFYGHLGYYYLLIGGMRNNDFDAIFKYVLLLARKFKWAWSPWWCQMVWGFKT